MLSHHFSKMILLIFLYPLLLHLISTKTYYLIPLSPLNLNLATICKPFGAKTCEGTLASPFDNLATAFQTAILMSSFPGGDKNLLFNLITNVDGIFPLGSIATSYTTISPFETFEGFINSKFFLFLNGYLGNVTIQGIKRTDLSTGYVNNNALIYLSTENFMFKIKGNLTLSYITITGIDMHMDAVPCVQRPQPMVCSCAVDTLLYNAASVCSIKKGIVQNNDNVYAGFFQLSKNFRYF